MEKDPEIGTAEAIGLRRRPVAAPRFRVDREHADECRDQPDEADFPAVPERAIALGRRAEILHDLLLATLDIASAGRVDDALSRKRAIERGALRVGQVCRVDLRLAAQNHQRIGFGKNPRLTAQDRIAFDTRLARAPNVDRALKLIDAQNRSGVHRVFSIIGAVAQCCGDVIRESGRGRLARQYSAGSFQVLRT
ncbi:Uncharacterised protein [Clostridium sporogenes]|nr:Uncharacterised protein [Clostridium sporogenes]